MSVSYPQLGPSRSVKQSHTKFTFRREWVAGALGVTGTVSKSLVGGGQASTWRQFKMEWAQEPSRPLHLPFVPLLMWAFPALRARALPALVCNSLGCG